MKTNLLTILFFLLLLFSTGCDKPTKDTGFMEKTWKVQSIVNEGRRFTVPSGNTFSREEAYILRFIDDPNFVLNTSVNYAGGSYQIVSEGHIVINYGEETKVYNALEHQRNFDEQLVSAFNGVMSYSYTKNKLIFRGEENTEIVFVKHKR